MNDVTKLPKWAQQQIASLERQIQDQQRIIEDNKGNIENPSLFRSVFGNDNDDQPAATDGQHLYFKDAEGEILISVKFDAAERLININSWHGLLVQPRAGNSIHLLLPPR